MPIKVFQPDEDPNAPHAHSEHAHEHAKATTPSASPKHHATHHEPSSNIERLSYLLIAVIALVVVFNGIQLMQLGSGGTGGTGFAGPTADKTSGSIKLDANDDVVNEVIKAMIPTGTPEQYGTELGVSFDDPVPSLTVLARLDRAIATSALTPEQKTRYVSTVSKISCEYCCSAPAVADANGRDLCGCSHALAIRGLTKYLVTQHSGDWTDEQIYWEVTRWKSIFFPSPRG
ncbi:MAG: hypothetical protein AABY01_02270, partial [Nanoarchaeota archaeon]